MTATRILIAGIQESNKRLSRLFCDCDVRFVRTMDEAGTALLRPYDVVLIAIRFDESRMFELLRHIKSDGRLSKLPVICYRSAPGPVTATALARQAIELATHALGATFVDLVSDSDTERANERLRDTVFGAVEASTRDSRSA